MRAETMWSRLLLGALAGLVAGSLLGLSFKRRSVFAIAALGAIIGVAVAFFTASKSANFPLVETPEQFQKLVLDSPQPVVVDFYTDNCIYCKMLTPTLEKLADEYAGKINFVKVHAGRSPKLSETFKIKAVPTVILFVHSAEASKWLGNQPASNFRPALDKAVQGS